MEEENGKMLLWGEMLCESRGRVQALFFHSGSLLPRQLLGGENQTSFLSRD